jgi:hypothetical protein
MSGNAYATTKKKAMMTAPTTKIPPIPSPLTTDLPTPLAVMSCVCAILITYCKSFCLNFIKLSNFCILCFYVCTRIIVR